jgi:hypothetical protein
MTTENTPPVDTEPTIRTDAPSTYPFLDRDVDRLSAFLRQNGPDSALSRDQFLVVDARTLVDRSVLFVRSVSSGTAESVRLSVENANAIPIAIDVGSMGMEQLKWGVGADNIFRV